MLRPLGAFEQVFHLYAQRHPVHFSLTAHLSPAVQEEQVRRAAAVLQQVHPLLGATVVDGEEDGHYRAFYRRSDEPVPVTRAAGGQQWADVIADEQVRPFSLGRGPHWRVVLLDPAPGRPVGDAPVSTVVVTFDHRIADGSAALHVLDDMVAVLNGRRPPTRAMAPAEEDLVLGAVTDDDSARPERSYAETADAPPPPRGLPASLRVVDGTPPATSAVALSTDQTDRLRQECRRRGVTVHALLAAALTRSLTAAGRDPARVVHPTDLRRPLGLDDDVALRIRPAPPVTAAAADDAEDAWSLAHGIGAQLHAARRPTAVLAAVRALQDQLPTDPDEAVAGMLAMSSTDAMLTNLGVVDLDASTADGETDAGESPEGVVRVVGLEALAMSVGISGEQVVGALTHRGQLRLTCTSHDPVPGLLDDVVTELDAACHR